LDRESDSKISLKKVVRDCSVICRKVLNKMYVNLVYYSVILVLRAVAHLVKALRYKPVGRGFDSRWCHWNLSVTLSFRSHYGPGAASASNRNE
jgi:hypothetical protein